MRFPIHHTPVAAALAAALAAVGAARPAAAQEQRLFIWSGSIDRSLTFTMQDNRVAMNGRGGQLQTTGTLPRYDGTVRVVLEQGRGRAIVIQPTRDNLYTAQIIVRDQGAGDDQYHVVAYFTPAGAYAYPGNVVVGGNGGRPYPGGNNNPGTVNRPFPNGGRPFPGGGRPGGGSASTPGRMVFSGRVDGDEEIRVQGQRVDVRTISGTGATEVRSRVDGMLNGPAFARVDRVDGRGAVEIAQQPSPGNGYVLVLRVRDRQPGSGQYRIEASW